jgi:hypothetical protein
MEKKRQTLVNLIYCVFLAIIFEGVLRKWVFPSQQQILFFVRDPFVILAYLYALHHGLKPASGVFFYASAGFTGVITIFSFFQTIYSHLPWWIIAYSWRTHFLMLPLSILIGSFMKTQDLKKLFRFSLYLTPLYAVVAYFQSTNEQSHWINAGRLGMFKPLPSAEGIIRTEGFFTSSVGNSLFAGMLVAILAVYLLKDTWADLIGKRLLYVSSLSTASIIVMSGQRSTFILACLIITSALVASLMISRRMLIKFFQAGTFAIILSAFLLFYVFPQHRAAITTRFVASSPESEFIGSDLVERIRADFFDFGKSTQGQIPAMGLGLGYSSNAALVYNISVMQIYSEGEWGRHIIELGPYFGFLTIIFRLFIFIYLLVLALSRAFFTKDPSPLIFLAVIASSILSGQLTGNGIGSGFIWFLAGVVLALSRIEEPASSKPSDEPTNTP